MPVKLARTIHGLISTRLVQASYDIAFASKRSTFEIHTVSLQTSSPPSHIDILLSLSSRSTVICSWVITDVEDGAGEVVAVGADVKRWKTGGACSWNLTEEIKTVSSVGKPMASEGNTSMFLLTCVVLTAYNALKGSRSPKGEHSVLALGTGDVSTCKRNRDILAGREVRGSEEIRCAALNQLREGPELGWGGQQNQNQGFLLCGLEDEGRLRHRSGRTERASEVLRTLDGFTLWASYPGHVRECEWNNRH
ncbi:hypothetical protein BKA82DRAFT_4015142 [Pisolithus tinctorius]|nr:hypothetical protein BKA82DRAFT_4015142 [Pisolithus tinctorius]